MATGIGQESAMSAEQILKQFPVGSSKYHTAEKILKNLGNKETFIASKPTAMAARVAKADAHVPGSELTGNIQVRNMLDRNAERIEQGKGLRMPSDSKAVRRNGGTLLRTPKKVRFVSAVTHNRKQVEKTVPSRRGTPKNTQYAAQIINTDDALAKRIDKRQAAEAQQLNQPRPAPIRQRLQEPPQTPPHRQAKPSYSEHKPLYNHPVQQHSAETIRPSAAPSAAPSVSTLRNKLLAGGGDALLLGAAGLGMHAQMRAAAISRRNRAIALGAGGAGIAGLTGLLASSRDR